MATYEPLHEEALTLVEEAPEADEADEAVLGADELLAEAERLRTAFELADADRDGRLTWSQLRALLRLLGMPADQLLSEVIYYATGDTVTIEQFVALTADYGLPRSLSVSWMRTLAAGFAEVDADDNGDLDQAELRRALTRMGVVATDEEHAELFTFIDTDGSGVVSPVELAAVLVEAVAAHSGNAQPEPAPPGAPGSPRSPGSPARAPRRRELPALLSPTRSPAPINLSELVIEPTWVSNTPTDQFGLEVEQLRTLSTMQMGERMGAQLMLALDKGGRKKARAAPTRAPTPAARAAAPAPAAPAAAPARALSPASARRVAALQRGRVKLTRISQLTRAKLPSWRRKNIDSAQLLEHTRHIRRWAELFAFVVGALAATISTWAEPIARVLLGQPEGGEADARAAAAAEEAASRGLLAQALAALTWLLVVEGLVVMLASCFEVSALYYMALRAAMRMSQSVGLSLTPLDSERAFIIGALARSALQLGHPTERDPKLGINPLRRASRLRLFLAAVLWKAKASIATMVAKILVKRALARAATKQVLRWVAVPVMGFIDGMVMHLTLIDVLAIALSPQLTANVVDALVLAFGTHRVTPDVRLSLYRAVGVAIVSIEAHHPTCVLILQHLARLVGTPLKGAELDNADALVVGLMRLHALAQQLTLRMLFVALAADRSVDVGERLLILRCVQACEGVDEPRSEEALELALDIVDAGRPLDVQSVMELFPLHGEAEGAADPGAPAGGGALFGCIRYCRRKGRRCLRLVC